MKKLFMLICLVSSLYGVAQEWKLLFNGKDLQNLAYGGADVSYFKEVNYQLLRK